MTAHFIFVEGCDTEPAKLPVYMVESEKHASHICEGIKETEYGLYRFSFVECTKSDLCKFPFWAKMTIDAQAGVYGNIIGGIYDMIDEAYSIMSGRRIREKYTSGVDTQTATTVETPQKSEANGEADQFDGPQALPGTIGADEIGNYVLFSKIMAKHLPNDVFPTDKQLKKFLGLHADEIKQGRPAKPDGTPHKQRFVIHVADWLKQRDDFAIWWKVRYANADEPNEQQKADAIKRQAAIRETKKKAGSREQLPGNFPATSGNFPATSR